MNESLVLTAKVTIKKNEKMLSHVEIIEVTHLKDYFS